MPMGDQHHDLYHDDQADGRQPQQSSPVSHLQDPATGASASTSPQLSNASASHKRKRDSIDDSEGREDGRSVREGSGSGRRSSFKQPSPNLSNAGSFMPVNTNSKVNQAGSPYSFQPMSNSQSPLTTMNGSTNADAANAALVAAGAMSGMLPQMTVPQPTSMGFAPVDGSGKGGEHGQLDNTFGALSPPPVEGHTEGVGGNHNVPGNHSHHGSPPVGPSGNPNPKPQVGTEEWHRVRRDNHKEVERRRRETINEGINELAKIVPGCEKNKGSILQRAVQYIQQLKENEAANIEKWTLEKILTEQAISELSANNEKLQKECERAWREAETWKKSCLQAGVTRDGGAQAGGSS